MFIDVGNPGFFKIVGSIRRCLTFNKKFWSIARFGNPLVFEAARIWCNHYECMAIVGGEEWAWDKMVHKHFDEIIEQCIGEAYEKIVERIGVEVGTQTYLRSAQEHAVRDAEQP